jgi:YceG-like family
LTGESDWLDPLSGDDEAARDRERRRAEREARRRERLGERVREEMSTAEAPAQPPPAPAQSAEPPPAEAPPAASPPPPPAAPARPTAEHPAAAPAGGPPPGRPPRATVARRRLLALFGLLALVFAGFVVVVAAKRIGGDDAPAAPPPKARPTISVTIPEGYSRDQIAKVAKEAGLEGDYMKETESFKGFKPERYGAEDPANLEGFLFPATYELFKNAKAEDLVAKQLEAFEQNIAAIDLKEAQSKNLTIYDVVTIASMIEREVQVPEERPNVASVIYNRLSDGMPLGIDATIRFEDSNYDEQLLESRLNEDTPYNTRTNTGLPPGPIGNPGLSSLEAAANPADTDFRFFVVQPGTCGEHVFTETEDEFFAAEAEYQAALQAEGGSPTEC